jgi:type IV pilus assembly protein PilO
MAPKLDMKGLPTYVKWIIALLPSIVISALVIFLVIVPKQKEIKALEAKIDEQNNQIASSIAKGARLEALRKENEILLLRLNELKEHLPEEKEVSSLLKQVSDLSIASGLDVKVWRPGAKRTHPSGIVYEIPVSVVVQGTYHDLVGFLSSITKLIRIVNINDLRLATGRAGKGKRASNLLDVTFTASTFSAIPEAELEKAKAEQAGKKKRR